MVKKVPAETRPPIVVILGHVDHGKTTLLDYVRRTHRAAKEAGGITQSIGAYRATFEGKPLTFIDTPGHAAFGKMRSRGAKIADIAVLVVAGDDSVKPQTLESIKHIKEAGIPFVVAINKIDKDGVIPDVVKAELTQAEVYVEGYGGNTPCVLISGSKGTGVPELLETILLLAELESIEASPMDSLQAPIIESHKDNHKGLVVSSVITSGQLSLGSTIYAGSAKCRLKMILDDLGKPLAQALPGMPVQLLGWDSLPQVGEVITSTQPELQATTTNSEPTEKIQSSERLNIILKADNQGSLEAIIGSFPPEVIIIHQETGDITESDVLLAATTKAIILGFNSKVPSTIKKLAEVEHVKILSHKIIYELLEFIEKKILRLLEPNYDEIILGEGTVLKVFEINKDKIAGTRLTSGKFATGQTVHLKRVDGTIKDARIKALRVGKDEVKQVVAPTECGVLLFPNLDLSEKEVIIAYQKAAEDLL